MTNLEPVLEESLREQLWRQIDAVAKAEEDAKRANVARKTARNKLAELLNAMGVTGFSIGA